MVLLLLGGRVELWEVGAKDNWARVRQRHLVVAWNTRHACEHHGDGQAAENKDQDEVEGMKATCNESHEHQRLFRLSTTQCCNSLNMPAVHDAALLQILYGAQDLSGKPQLKSNSPMSLFSCLFSAVLASSSLLRLDLPTGPVRYTTTILESNLRCFCASIA